MKKLIFGLAFVGILSLTSNAHASRGTLLIGPTMSHMAYESTGVTGVKMGVGFSFLGLTGVDLGNGLGLDFGTEFTQTKVTLQTSAGDVDFSVGVLRIPVLLNYNLPETVIHFHLGPYIGVLPTGRLGNTTQRSVDSIDFGLMGGASAIFPLATDSAALRVSAFYNFGFTDLNSGTAVVMARDFSIMGGVDLKY